MEYVKDLIDRYKTKGILIDANLLLLLFIGLYDRRRILSFGRTQGYTSKDFDMLVEMINFFGKVVTTPNILTEVSNLSGKLNVKEKEAYFTDFANHVSRFDEEYAASDHLCSLSHFTKFGLTDAGIINGAAGKYLVLTDDFKLSAYLESERIDVINFNHIRDLN
jgi:hypothetical protein